MLKVNATKTAKETKPTKTLKIQREDHNYIMDNLSKNDRNRVIAMSRVQRRTFFADLKRMAKKV
jgi:hypothetical protein